MIVSENFEASINNFSNVLTQSVFLLKQEAKGDAKKYISSGGTKFEGLVLDALNESAKGTEFEGSIKLASGQKFPDIILEAGGFGVEVKSTTQNHWITTGNSVLESTRVPNIKKVFLMFGKLAQPIDFKVRPYEECLKEVLVTHYPRYQIDMNLRVGETIFDKIGKSYEEIRSLSEPVAPMIKYYSSKLKEGESLWWTQNSDINEQGSPFTIRELSKIKKEERTRIIAKSMILFPEIFSAKTDKFHRVLMWLLRDGIICGNIRDFYTAGGTWDYSFDGKIVKVPQVVKRLYNIRDEFLYQLHEICEQELHIPWNKSSIIDRDITWFNLVEKEVNNAKVSQVIFKILFSKSIQVYKFPDVDSCNVAEPRYE